MKKYVVQLVRRLYQIGDVEVSAKNQNEAYTLVKRALMDEYLRDSDAEWGRTEKEAGEFDVTGLVREENGSWELGEDIGDEEALYGNIGDE
jgi:hypothetical protein